MIEPTLMSLKTAFLRPVISRDEVASGLRDRGFEVDPYCGTTNLWCGLSPLEGTGHTLKLSLFENRVGRTWFAENGLGLVIPREHKDHLAERLVMWFGAAALPREAVVDATAAELKEIGERSKRVMEGMCGDVFEVVRWNSEIIIPV